LETKYWEGGLQLHEVEAIKKIEQSFSEPARQDNLSKRQKNVSGGSLQDQLLASGLVTTQGHSNNQMMNWKGYAGFRFVDARENDGEFDLLIVTHCIILIIELKDWNHGKVISHGDKWFKNKKDMGRSPVSVTRNKKFLIENKLKPYKQKFTNKGFIPQVHFLVVMCGNTDLSGLTEEEKKYTLKLADFMKLKDSDIFDKKFRPHPNSKTLLSDIPLLDSLFFNDAKLIQPKHLVVNGYKAKEEIFPHPFEIYREYQAISQSKDQALLRVWDFSKLDRAEAKTPDGRYSIVSREQDVLHSIKHQNNDLYLHCLRSLTGIQQEDVTSQYSELYELPPGHERFNQFIGKYGESFTEEDRVNLVKLLVARFADLHGIKIAHRDIGDHSIWISPSKEIALSNFISAYHQPLGTVGDFREALSVNEGSVPAGMLVNKSTTPFQMDIYTLGMLSWHILQARRLSPKSLKTVKDEITGSDDWYSPVIKLAIDGHSFRTAKDFFEALKESEPAINDKFDFDVEELSAFTHAINHSRQYRENDDFLVETDSKEVYRSNGRLVKAWLNVSPINDQPAIGRKVLHFCQRVSELQSLALHYLPCIHEYGLAAKSSSLYLLTEYIDGSSWGEIDADDEQKFGIINQFISVIEHLHGLGIAHGDLHPENVKVKFDEDKAQIYLLDLPDFSLDSEQVFNHQYSPEAIDGSSAFERDVFAVLRMSCELLGIEWGELPGLYLYLENAVRVEIEDLDFGFHDLSRFKEAVSASQSGETDEMNLFEISIRGDFESLTIYPDNGSLYVSFEKDKKDSSRVKVAFKGIGGQVSLIYSSQQSEFIVGFQPWARSVVSQRDIESSQLELPFGITVNSGSIFELGDLSREVEHYDEFARALDSAISTFKEEVVSEKENTVLDEKEQAQTQKSEKTYKSSMLRLNKPRIQKLSTAKVWDAVLQTETESHPFVTVHGDVRSPENNKDELIIYYRSEFNVLDKFDKNDEIEAIKVVDEEDICLGKVLLRQSGLNEVRLTKLTFHAKKLEEHDVIYFRSKQDRASYQKRRNALDRLLSREGVISNLIDYFDSESADKGGISYPIHVSDDDFARYDRVDDHGNEISLNQQQREAFQKLLQNGPLSLLQGPPGTGKTEFIAAFVHYLLEKQNVKNILLVSQSHEAVNTAAERIRKHCKRLDTPLEVVRFSNREGAVSQGLKDVYSNAIVTEKRELFRAEIGYRVKSLSRVLGLQPEYLADLVRAEIRLFKLIDQLTSFIDNNSSVNDEDNAATKKSISELKGIIVEVLTEEYGIDAPDIDNLVAIKQKVLSQLEKGYAIRPDEAKRARVLVKISMDLVDVLDTDRVNYDEFLARSRQLVTGTCVGIGQWHIGIAKNQYDWVIIDEAARSIASELAIAMQSAKRVLLVGDHKQLPPLYSEPHKKALARKLGITADKDELEVLLQSDFSQAFESAYGSLAGAKLLTQYRMAEPIGNLVSSVFYDEELLTGNRVIPSIYQDVPDSLTSTVNWIDTTGMSGATHQTPKKGASIYNRCEADEIIKLLRDISERTEFIEKLSSVVKENEPAIGIICMYAEQKKLLLKKFKEEIWQDNFSKLVNIDTVDSYQGKENRIIILSITRNIANLSPGFLKSPNRINVAISRAMDKLVIVGATDMWRAQNKELPLGKILQFIESKTSSGYQLVNNFQRRRVH
jgi:serine/threonine protein kinase